MEKNRQVAREEEVQCIRDDYLQGKTKQTPLPPPHHHHYHHHHHHHHQQQQLKMTTYNHTSYTIERSREPEATARRSRTPRRPSPAYRKRRRTPSKSSTPPMERTFTTNRKARRRSSSNRRRSSTISERRSQETASSPQKSKVIKIWRQRPRSRSTHSSTSRRYGRRSRSRERRSTTPSSRRRSRRSSGRRSTSSHETSRISSAESRSYQVIQYRHSSHNTPPETTHRHSPPLELYTRKYLRKIDKVARSNNI